MHNWLQAPKEKKISRETCLLKGLDIVDIFDYEQNKIKMFLHHIMEKRRNSYILVN